MEIKLYNYQINASMITKLKIEISGSVLEIEGEESFVREIYQDYKERIPQASTKAANNLDKYNADTPKNRKTKASRLKRVSENKKSFQIVENIDFSGKNGKEGLKNFYEKKSPKTALQKNTVFVFYLKKIKKINNVSPNHIYTCYKYVNQKLPSALHQSLYDTSNKKKLIDTKSTNNIGITVLGENLVEHELPSKK